MKINIPLKAEVRGRISLGPVPGTPEYEEEQRKKRRAKEETNAEPEHGGG